MGIGKANDNKRRKIEGKKKHGGKKARKEWDREKQRGKKNKKLIYK